MSAVVTAGVSSADVFVQNFGNDWLTNMHEISLPEAVSWLAWTPFSCGVLFLLVLFFLRFLWRCYGAWRDRLYRRQALQKLRLLMALWREPDHRIAAAQGLAQLIRQVALTAWPSADVSSKLGVEWLKFLQASVEPPAAVPSLLAQLSHLPAARVEEISEAQWQALMDWSEHWIRGHRVSLATPHEVFDAGL